MRAPGEVYRKYKRGRQKEKRHMIPIQHPGDQITHRSPQKDEINRLNSTGVHFALRFSYADTEIKGVGFCVSLVRIMGL